MKKIFCDKCGCEIEWDKRPFLLEFKIKKVRYHSNLPNDKIKIHLCLECTNKLNKWLEEGEDSK